MLDFRTETFLCVCEERNYTKAAGKLHITQPAVSQHIRYLEKYYGVQLFFVSGKQMVLTEAGKQLKNALLAMKHDESHLMHRMENGDGHREKIVFGATLTIGEFLMPKKLAHYMRKNPDVEIEMIIDNTEQLLTLLDKGEIEFAAIEGFYPKNEYEFLTISKEPFIAVGKKWYMEKKIEGIKDLFLHRLFLRESGSGSREILVRYLKDNGYRLEDFEKHNVINNIGALKQMVCEGEGITFIYEAAVRDELNAGIMEEIKVPHFNVFHDFDFVWRKGSIYNEYYRREFFSLELGGAKGENTLPH